MAGRVDTAARLIHASASAIYQAFATPGAMETWLPPEGMTGTMLALDFREGGSYRMRLTYDESQHSPGKTSQDTDEVEVDFVRLVPGELIEQAVSFKSEDPAFSGTIRIAWTLESVQNGTLVTVRCENVPAGIRRDEHRQAWPPHSAISLRLLRGHSWPSMNHWIVARWS